MGTVGRRGLSLLGAIRKDRRWGVVRSGVVGSVEQGVVIAGKYRLERPLARGGMGAVWVARHVDLDVDVALKLVAEELSGRAATVRRFEREAKAAAKLKSPHVTHIHDYGVHEGRPYLVMELLEGEDLAHHLQRERPLAPGRAAEIFTALCRGLAEAHGRGIVHRDLKPSNVFLARSGGQEIVKILDFGIAKDTRTELAEGDRTASGTVLGSPRYMSPEQATGGEVDAKSDLWSAAVVLYEMVSGKQLFAAANVGRVIADICASTPPRPSTLGLGLSPAIDAFFAVALDREPGQRFGAALEMAEAFAAVARGEAMPERSRVDTKEKRGRDEPTAELSEDAVSVDLTSATRDAPLAAIDDDDPAAPADDEAGEAAERDGAEGSAGRDAADVPRARDEPTSPGVGMDSGPTSLPRRRAPWLIVAIGAAAAAGVVVWIMAAAPASSPATASSAAEVPPPPPSPARAGGSSFSPLPDSTARAGGSSSALPSRPAPPRASSAPRHSGVVAVPPPVTAEPVGSAPGTKVVCQPNEFGLKVCRPVP